MPNRAQRRKMLGNPVPLPPRPRRGTEQALGSQNRHSEVPPSSPPVPLSGIQTAVLELAAIFGNPAVSSSQGEQAGGSPEAWLAFVQEAPPLDVLGVLATFVQATRQRMGAAPQAPALPRLYLADGRAAL